MKGIFDIFMKKCIFIFFISYLTLFSQSQLINNNHIVYDYLLYLHTIGDAKNYDNLILPLSQKKIEQLIQSSKINSEFNYSLNPVVNNVFFLDSLGLIKESFFSKDEVELISYSDSLINISANPIISTKYLRENKNSTLLIKYGGGIKLNYGKNFVAFLEANNGFVGGDRDIALLDKQVLHSFSFNHTKIKYFDATRGYIYYETDKTKLFAGRNEILWGVNKLNPLILGNSSQNMDYISFNFEYKKFNYTFLHGWLVSKRTSEYIDSIVGDIRRKVPKYIAINRIGFNPNENLKLGITQSIIYANRPVELAYLNPLMLWESAQRSLNDLDNSFLGLDLRWMPLNGVELLSNIIFDDLNFNLWGDGKWNTPDNRFAWQLGANIAYPYLPKNFLLVVDYTQIRPFTFSHPEINESLSYTNNGYPLGTNLLPNSIAFSAELNFFANPNLLFSCRYDNIRHGDNEYDENGNLVFNNGGSYFISTTLILNSKEPKILDGILSEKQRLILNVKHYLSYSINYNVTFLYENEKKNGVNNSFNYLGFELNYNFY
jgi:hypothetical protein